MNAHEVLAHLNAERGTSYRLAGGFAQGESGTASQVSDADGNRYVLKFSSADNHEFRVAKAVCATARLRHRGYLAPDYVARGEVGGISYGLQTAMRGDPIGERVSLALLPQILHLNDLQRGQSDSADENPERIIRGVMEGYEGYCVVDTLRTYSEQSVAIRDRLQRLVVANASDCPRRKDIVHWDFHTNNVLMENDRITGVIDWEGCCSGDATFDLATMLFYTWSFADFREALLRAMLERTTPGAVAVYLAHMIVRQLDWSMRHHPREAVDRLMKLARAILGRIEK